MIISRCTFRMRKSKSPESLHLSFWSGNQTRQFHWIWVLLHLMNVSSYTNICKQPDSEKEANSGKSRTRIWIKYVIPIYNIIPRKFINHNSIHVYILYVGVTHFKYYFTGAAHTTTIVALVRPLKHIYFEIDGNGYGKVLYYIHEKSNKWISRDFALAAAGIITFYIRFYR